VATDADRELIAFAKSHDREVELRQLKRWRTLGLMPERKRKSLGRGRGFTSTDKPWARFQMLAVIDALAHDRSADRARLRLWYDGWDIPTTRVRMLIERRVSRDRGHFADLEAQALASFGVATAFDVMDLDSAQRPITRDEVKRMRPLAAPGDTASQLAHAARSALQGQLIASPDETIAVDELQASKYLAVARFDDLFAAVDAPPDIAVGEVLTGLQNVPERAVLDTPTERQFEHARWRLRYRAYLPEVLRTAQQDEIPQTLLDLLADLIEQQNTFDPDHPQHHVEDLITALRVMPAMRPEPVAFTE